MTLLEYSYLLIIGILALLERTTLRIYVCSRENFWKDFDGTHNEVHVVWCEFLMVILDGPNKDHICTDCHERDVQIRREDILPWRLISVPATDLQHPHRWSLKSFGQSKTYLQQH